MKKGDIIEGVIDRVDFPNRGILISEEQKLVVKDTIPGQRVRARVTKIRKGRGEGTLQEVLERSPLEGESPCPHFGSCGGCLYMSLPYEAQMEIKRRQVEELLTAALEGNLAESARKPAKNVATAIFEGIESSPRVYEYRNKMEFSFGDEVKDGPLALGMHKRGGFYDIVTVGGCRLVDEDFRKILWCVRDYFSGMQVPFYHRMRHTGYLRHLLVRKGIRTGEILVDLITTSQVDSDDDDDGGAVAGAYGGANADASGDVGARTDGGVVAGTHGDATGVCGGERYPTKPVPILRLRDELLKLPLEGKIVGILHTFNDSVADAVKNDRTLILHGRDYFYEELLGMSFRISPFSFFQTNTLGAEILYRTAREFVGDLGGVCSRGGDGKNSGSGEGGKVIFDLYSGTGTIAQMMAPVAKKVIGVELVEEAVMAARENAKRNGIANCEFIAGDVLKVLDEIKEKPDIIILDPPRDGVHPKALQKIIDYGVDRLVYISCKPTSLVRDLQMFLEAGYEVERVCGVDMFAWTGNVECVVLMSRVEK